MKIELRYLALGLVALLGSLLASSQPISAYEATDRLSSSSAAGATVVGAKGVRPEGASAAPSNLAVSFLYLPVVMKPVTGILGYLTQGGVPAPNISLELWFSNGSSPSMMTTTTTNTSGYYFFPGIPALAVGQYYNVVYSNPENAVTRLSLWVSRDITSYTASSNISLGTSDLADITLVSHPATVALPYTFHWTRRTATTSDSYFWELFDPADNNPYVSTYPFGYYSGFTLNHLPTGFGPGVQYGWDVGVLDANSGIGFSYYYQYVRFSNVGVSSSAPLNIAPPSTGPRSYIPYPPRHAK